MTDLVADTEENRVKKLQLWRNGALSIKLTPSNTWGRKSGGAQFINTSKYYLMAYTFGSNQNIIMHDLRSSRDSDLRKIKLRRLLRQIFRQDPNKYQSTNWRYFSTSRKYYVPYHVICCGQIWILQESLWIKILDLEMGIWYKLWYTLYILFCISPTGQTNYNTQPISSDNNDCECYLLRWDPCLQNFQRISFFQPFHISQYLHTNNGSFLLFHSNNVHNDVFVLRELHFFSWMDAYGGYPLSKYGGICWVITEDIFLVYLLKSIRMIDQKMLLKSFGSAENVTQLTYEFITSKECDLV